MNSFLLGLISMGVIGNFRFDADKGAGSGGGAGADKGTAGDKGASGGGDDIAAIVKQLKADNDAMKAEIASLKGTPAPTDKTLIDKVKDDRKAKDDQAASQKDMEKALTFTLRSQEFLKDNEAVFPKELTELFKAADKETYDSPVQKANAIKAEVMRSFFNVQANMDVLTPSMKQTLEDYLKLTKNGREEKANVVFENVFEPALAMVKNQKKAEEIQRARMGHGTPSDADSAMKEKLRNIGKKHYLREREK